MDAVGRWGGETWEDARSGWLEPQRPIKPSVRRTVFYDLSSAYCLMFSGLFLLLSFLLSHFPCKHALRLTVWDAVMCCRVLRYADDLLSPLDPDFVPPSVTRHCRDARRASEARGKNVAQKHRLGKPPAAVSSSRGTRRTRGALHPALLLSFICISCCVPSGYAMLATNKGLLPAQTLISAVQHVAVPVALARAHHASGRWSDAVICNMPAGANFTKPADLTFDRVPDHLWSTGRA